MRLFVLALLTMVSMGAGAAIEVTYGKDGSKDPNFTGGKVLATPGDEKDGKVTFTLDVSPDNGYTITKDDIEVYATISPAGTRANPEISKKLDLEGKDPANASDKRTYTFTIESDFGVWVKEAKFLPDGSKGGSEPTRSIIKGAFYIANANGYNSNNTATNFYLVPATNSNYTDNQPHLTTSKTDQELNSCWQIVKDGDYYRIIHMSDGKYLTANPAYSGTSGNNLGRLRVHLEEMDTPDNNTLFEIQLNDNGGYNIRHKDMADKINNSTTTYLDPAGGNINGTDLTNYRTMVTSSGNVNIGGGIGYWTDEPAARWYFEPALSIAPPTITNKFDGTITITAEEGATIYYTTDGTMPTTSSSEYSAAIMLTNDITRIKAIAKGADDPFPTVASTYILPVCERPVISVSGGIVTITCATNDAEIHYTTDGTPATSTSGTYSGPFPKGDISTIRAIAIKTGYANSSEAALLPPTEVSSSSQITNMNGSYILASNFTSSGSIGTADNPFKGIINGNLNTFTLGYPLVAYADGATIKNVILDNVSISSGNENGNAGAICCEAMGDTRIYNCGVLSGSIGGSNKVGGIVGRLEGSSRVINCFSYATITGGTDVGGIVGYNSEATTASDIKTMVMNCMFYGDITGGTTVSPVYGGENINNLQGGLNTFNYYAYEKLKTKAISNNKYNCALAVEDKYLTRFEYYRLLLNSNKKLAAFYATGSVDNADQMAKWVLETADRTIYNPKPYPVLKAQGYYPSIINPDFEHAPEIASVGRNKGGKLGKTLSVKINSVGSDAPSDASITNGNLTLQRTDKDFDRFNFNYDKVQLPYYNEVGTGNYTGNRVVTGWKITAITDIEGDPYTSANYPATGVTDFPNHNYADRKSSNKDLYSVSKRVFSQGAYFDVPYGVTSITIEPYWGNAIYVADQYYDVVYKNDYTGKQDVSQVGTQITTFNGQSVKNSITGLGSGTTVYDNAVVLVGNFHLDGVPSGGGTPFTMMSVDEDNDHEPDYSLIYHHKERTAIAPIRFDFLNIPGTAQAQKPNGADLICNFTIFKTKGWFEVTNTSSFYTSQLEYENLKDVTKSDAPLILLGGVIDQFVSTQNQAVNGKTIYIHVGGNVWINSFGLGTHSDGNYSTPHVPVSVTGGEFEGFYLTGTYNANAGVRKDNAECYISGGYFHEAAGASLEQIDGNVRWQIYNADIDEFFGGGVNDAKPITGDVTVDIYNSYVTLFCGGPKFGNMQTGKNVTTNAEGCTFGKYFGAGYGGTSISKKKYYDNTTPAWGTTLQGYFISDRGKYYDGLTTDAIDSRYGKRGPGIATDFDYEFFVWSSGKTGGRFFVKFADFSLAQCNDVSSTLKNCTVETNFYGGGNLGKVTGTATSILENCTVKGNVYGAGYSASLPTVEVRNEGFTKVPSYNKHSGMFEPAELSGTTTFTWQNATEAQKTLTNGKSGSDLEEHILYTNADLNTLGQVKNSNLIIKGTTTVAGDVYGGGALASMDESGETMVSLIGGTINGNVYGGAQGRLPGTKDENGKDLPEVKALVGNANVELNKDVAEGGCIVKGSIFGCNNLNGTPKGSAIVHIYRTNGDALTASGDLDNIDDTKHHYHLNAVYGGGNLAAYIPTADNANAKANVIIDGCGVTSIRTVYGGGNAASTPATSVVVNGTYEIEEVFGGGNGKDALPDGSDNPGANVGFKNYSAVEDTYSTKEQRQSNEFVNEYVYGSGEANVTIVGGRVHRVFGGSNTKGNVRITAVTMLDDLGGCHFIVDEAYGGGKSAPMDGEAKLLMSCIPGLKVAYGGAEDANILGDVTLNITNGNFDRVFGGNNISGTIGGKITVNVEETGCNPIIIGQLYGGGNQAPYDAHGQTGPTLNIKSFTSIGEVYGGGYGVSATVKGDTHVNINEVKGKFAAQPRQKESRTISFSEFVRNENGDFLDKDGHVTTEDSERVIVNQQITVDIPAFTANKIGGIGMVYGGGNAAKVDGNTHVNIGTQKTIDFVTGVDSAQPQTVEGVNIIGNVYGGGNKADVTGNTNVVVGKQPTN